MTKLDIYNQIKTKVGFDMIPAWEVFTVKELQDILDRLEEFDNLMQAGYDEIAVGDQELATEYFADAGSVLNSFTDNDELKKVLANKYSINPMDFAR